MLIKVTHESNFNHWEINNHEIGDLTSANISLLLTENDTITAVFNEQNTSDIFVINEFMADNESIIVDETGEYEDWVELYYNIPYTMSLDGYFLTDNFDKAIARLEKIKPRYVILNTSYMNLSIVKICSIRRGSKIIHRKKNSTIV